MNEGEVDGMAHLALGEPKIKFFSQLWAEVYFKIKDVEVYTDLSKLANLLPLIWVGSGLNYKVWLS